MAASHCFARVAFLRAIVLHNSSEAEGSSTDDVLEGCFAVLGSVTLLCSKKFSRHGVGTFGFAITGVHFYFDYKLIYFSTQLVGAL